METLQTIEPGWDVLGSDDQKIGSVSEVGDGFVLVKKGVIFAKEIYVPTDAITATDPAQRTVVVNIPKAAVENMGWSSPPEVPLPPIGSDSVVRGGPANSFGMPPIPGDLRAPAEESVLEERTTEEANAASTGWEGATEVVKDDFEREELRRKETEKVLPPLNR